MRVFWFLFLTVTSFTLPWWVAFAAATVYVCTYYRAYEVLLLAACLDALYGSAAFFPFIYTGVSLLLLLVIEYVKPLLSFYRIEDI